MNCLRTNFDKMSLENMIKNRGYDEVPMRPIDRLEPLRKDEKKRRKTFNKFPKNAEANIDELLDDGFFYIGDGENDRVQCAFCGGVLKNWHKGDNVNAEHRRIFSRCTRANRVPFLNHGETRSALFSMKNQIDGGQSVLAKHDVETDAAPIQNPTKDKPRHPDYSLKSTRLNTYKSWPTSMNQKPDDLAEAGLFYTGEADKTLCYQCGGALLDWETDDIPAPEHDKWFPDCLLAMNRKKVSGLEATEGHHHYTGPISTFCTTLHRHNGCQNYYVKRLCHQQCHDNNLNCYKCQTDDLSSLCHQHAPCHSNEEVCAISMTITNTNTIKPTYILGCTNRSQCSIFQDHHHQITGASAVHGTGGCCYTDKCNHNATAIRQGPQCIDINTDACVQLLKDNSTICTNQTFSKDMCCQTCSKLTSCQDIDGQACQRLFSTVPNICQTQCIADLCKATCNNCQTITVAPGQATTTASTPANLHGQVTASSSTAAHHQGQVTTTQSTSAHHQNQITTTTSTPANHHGQVTTAPSTPANHQGQVTTTASGLGNNSTSQNMCNQTQPKTCPLDFVPVCGRCYFFSNQPESWQDAQNICKALNGYLVELETDDEKSFLKDHLIKKYHYDRHFVFWLGGKRDQNQWLWQTATTPVRNIVWGQNDKPDSSPNMDCLEFGPMWDYKMNNADCLRASHFICELN